MRLSDELGSGTKLVRLGCALLIAAAVLKTVYTGMFEPEIVAGEANWGLKMTGGFVVFVAAYLLAQRAELGTRQLATLLVLQSISAIFLVSVSASIVLTALIMVVVAWQIALATSFRNAIAAVAVQSVLAAFIKCVDGPVDTMSLLVLVTTFGFEFFAVSAAHLARGEALARANLSRVNDELRATQLLLTESARMSERMRISRDLHDALGHTLTGLTIHLDVASRLTKGKAAAHLQSARDMAGGLLGEVRTAVSQIRVAPVDLKDTLLSITEGVVGLDVQLVFPDDLFAIDAPRADAILRCIQELITNALRHAVARKLVIELTQLPDGELVITGTDDGQGGKTAEGAGLAGMRERFEMLGGRLSISSPPRHGFTVQGRIPAFGALA